MVCVISLGGRLKLKLESVNMWVGLKWLVGVVGRVEMCNWGV